MCALILINLFLLLFFVKESLFIFSNQPLSFSLPLFLSRVFLLCYLVSNIYSSAISRAISDEDIDADEVGFTNGNIRVPLMRKEPCGN